MISWYLNISKSHGFTEIPEPRAQSGTRIFVFLNPNPARNPECPEPGPMPIPDSNRLPLYGPLLSCKKFSKWPFLKKIFYVFLDFFIKQTDEVESLLIIRSNVTHHSRSANCVPGTCGKFRKIPMALRKIGNG